MKTNNIISWFTKGIATILVAASSTAIQASASEYELAEHQIKWIGSTPVKTHEGLLTPQSAEITIDEDGRIQKLKVLLDMNSIVVTDIKNPGMRDKLVGHLKNDDFFSVSSYPTSSFELSKNEGDVLSGKIVIKGIEQSIKIPIKKEHLSDGSWKLSSNFKFKRHDFNVSYQKKNLLEIAKDKIIHNEIDVEVNFTFNLVK